MIPDCDLLRQFVEQGDEAAFAEIVRRHADLVYSAALRLTSGNAALAQDVSQQVFIGLARKAGALSRHATLVGWLHLATRFAARDAIRSEQRRQIREQEAHLMHDDSSSTPDWDQIQPWLDEAVGQLNAADGEAVLLRFFQGKSHREVGEILGLSEDSARKRVERALEKLRKHFARKGVGVSSALLAAAMTSNAVQAAPAGSATLWPKAAGASRFVTKLSGWQRLADYIFMNQLKLKILFVAMLVIIVTGIGLLKFSAKSESARPPILAQIVKVALKPPPVVVLPAATPVPASNSQNSPDQNPSPITGEFETRDFALPPDVLKNILGYAYAGPGDEMAIQTKLIAAGVNFPPGAKLAYVAGKMYMTNTPINLDLMAAFLRRNYPDTQLLHAALDNEGKTIWVTGPEQLPAGATMIKE